MLCVKTSKTMDNILVLRRLYKALCLHDTSDNDSLAGCKASLHPTLAQGVTAVYRFGDEATAHAYARGMKAANRLTLTHMIEEVSSELDMVEVRKSGQTKVFWVLPGDEEDKCYGRHIARDTDLAINAALGLRSFAAHRALMDKYDSMSEPFKKEVAE
jgi:hypothetical protein